MQKQIHIIATSEFMSIDEVVPEEKAEQRLKDIRNLWLGHEKHQNTGDKLQVIITKVHHAL